MQSQKEMQQQGFTHAEKLNTMQMTQQENLANRAYNLDMQRLKGEQANQAADAGYRTLMAQNAAEEMKMKREAYDAAKPEAQMKMRDTQAKYLEGIGVP